MVEGLGGPADFVDRYDHYLPKADIVKPLVAETTGFINEVDARSLGLAVVQLGGGRRVAADAIDYRVGLTGVAELGQSVAAGEPLAMIHASSETAWKEAANMVKRAMTISDQRPELPPNVYERITA